MKSLAIGSLTLGVFLVTLTATNTADNVRDEAIRKDRKQIAGTWQLISFEDNGKPAKKEDVKKFTVVNGDDGTWTILENGKEIIKGTSTFDPTRNPKTIDFTVTEGMGKGQHFQGIYVLGENSRKMCFARPEKDRPTEFATRPGSEHILATFKRLKAK